MTTTMMMTVLSPDASPDELLAAVVATLVGSVGWLEDADVEGEPPGTPRGAVRSVRGVGPPAPWGFGCALREPTAVVVNVEPGGVPPV